MSLKTAMTADLDVMLNTDEHAQEVTVNPGTGAVTIVAILTSQEGELIDRPGLAMAGMVLRCKSSDLAKPKFRQGLTVDGVGYWVVGVEDNMGLMALTLERRES